MTKIVNDGKMKIEKQQESAERQQNEMDKRKWNESKKISKNDTKATKILRMKTHLKGISEQKILETTRNGLTTTKWKYRNNKKVVNDNKMERKC